MSEVAQAVTVDDLTAQIARVVEVRKSDQTASDLKKSTSALVEVEENKMLAMLDAAKLKNFRSDLGLVSVAYRTSVKTPKTPEDRAAFFEYLKSQGLYDQMVTVNSMTLNSFYKDQMETAVKEGKEDFEVPGLNEVAINPILSFRKS